MIAAAVVAAVVTLPGATAGAQASTAGACALGYELLADGAVDAAQTVFRRDPEACADGIVLADAQRARADALATQCEAAAKAADQADAETGWANARDLALTTCAEAFRLDRAQEDRVTVALGGVPATAPTVDADGPDAWWDTWWQNAQDLAVIGAQLALAILLALPILNALGIAIRRTGPVSLRRELSRSRRWRVAAATPLVAAIVLAVSEDGHRWWVPASLTIAGLVVLCLRAGHAIIAGCLVLTGLIVVATRVGDDRGDTASVLIAPVAAAVLLAWVLAQRRNVRIDAFTGGDDAATIAPLVATHLLELAGPSDGNVMIVDPFSAVDLDGDSVSVLSGPENKVVAAAIKLVRAVFQPGQDWTVTGQLVPADTRGISLALQLKHQRGTVAAGIVRAPNAMLSVPPTTPVTNHAELAQPAAAWALIELIRQLDGDLSHVRSLDGVTVADSLAKLAAGVQAQRRGDVAAAHELYARAIDADPKNRQARLAAALLAADDADADSRAALTDQLVAVTDSILHDVAGDATAVYSEAHLMALHARLIGRLNLAASGALPDGALARTQQPTFEAALDDLQLLDKQLRRSWSSLPSSLRLAFRTSLDSLRPLATGNLLDKDWLAAARQSPRAAYNGACIAATPLRRPRDIPLCVELLRIATRHPGYRARAATDPSLDGVRYLTEVRKLIGAKVDADGLASLDAIGTTYAKELAAVGITTLAGIRSHDEPTLVKATDAPLQLVALWKGLAGLDEIEGIGLAYTNLLYRCGITNPDELARANPDRLTALADGIAMAGGSTNSPSLDTIRTWIARTTG